MNKFKTSAIDYLVYAMGSAELVHYNEENHDMMVNIRATMSTNLRTLLN